jgi:ribosome-binding protein aMBF1 (putative translation factor)
MEPEVEQWLESLSASQFASAASRIDYLGELGSAVRMPRSRPLGAGLFELRFDVDRTAMRITYFFPGDRRIVLLTFFRKQRQNERAEVERLRLAMANCVERGQHGRRGGPMTRMSWMDLKDKKIGAMTQAERAEYDRAYAEARLAAEVGEHIHAAREVAGLSQRELARRMGTSQAAIDRLESGGVGATLTTLQRVATALDLEVSIELRPSA